MYYEHSSHTMLVSNNICSLTEIAGHMSSSSSPIFTAQDLFTMLYGREEVNFEQLQYLFK